MFDCSSVKISSVHAGGQNAGGQNFIPMNDHIVVLCAVKDL